MSKLTAQKSFLNTTAPWGVWANSIFLMSLYPLKAKMKQWPLRVLSHFVTFSICNGWIKHIRESNEEGISMKDIEDVIAFQTGVAPVPSQSTKASDPRVA